MTTKMLKFSPEAIEAIVHMWWLEHGKGEARSLGLFRAGSERAFTGAMKSLTEGRGLRENYARESEEKARSALRSVRSIVKDIILGDASFFYMALLEQGIDK